MNDFHANSNGADPGRDGRDVDRADFDTSDVGGFGNGQDLTGTDDQLVAYLDGELDTETAVQVERRLAGDADYRLRMQQFERAWNLLGGLPRATVDESFTRTTMEMVAVSAERDWSERQIHVARRKWWGAVVGIAGLAVAAFIGYLVTNRLIPNQDEQLLRDLPILEELDLYQQVRSVEFLEQIAASGAFPGDIEFVLSGQASPEAPKAGETLDQRRARIQRLDAEDKQRLREARERFDALKEEQKKRLRDVRDALDDASRGGELRRTMTHYNNWLNTLSKADLSRIDRAEDAEQRIARIGEIQKEQHQRYLRQIPDPNDVAAIVGWMDDYAVRREPAILERASDKEREFLAKTPEAHRRQFIKWTAWKSAVMSPPPGKLPPLDANDYQRLAARLSSETKRALEQAKAGERDELVLGWTRAATAATRTPMPWRPPPKPPSPEELQRIVEKLPPAEREQLQGKSPDEILRWLWQHNPRALRDGERRDGERRDKDRSRKPKGNGGTGDAPKPKDENPTNS